MGVSALIFLEDPDVTLHHGDALTVLRELPSESVHCCVTSPPFYGLRDYQVAGQIGLEETPEQWVARLVEVFREVRRVLRRDGTLWLEVGDSYTSNPGSGQERGNLGGLAGAHLPKYQETMRQAHSAADIRPRSGLKPKDLIGAPWMLAFALRADGWWLRADIIWARPNPMPESVTDRPTKSHSYVFLLTKSPRYFFDQEAVREQSITNDARRPYGSDGAWAMDGRNKWEQGAGQLRDTDASGRNVRSVWRAEEIPEGCEGAGWDGACVYPRCKCQVERPKSVWEIATQPFPEAHFATFPEKLVERCLKAGTSERGSCPECGAPWLREVERVGGTYEERKAAGVEGPYNDDPATVWKLHVGSSEAKTIGWQPGCACYPFPEWGGAPVQPCTVLDPFVGAGTVPYVARKLGLRSVGIDLNADYLTMAAKRLQQQSLFASA